MIQVQDIFGNTRTIEIGSEIFIPNIRGRGNHGAWVIVEKLNKKSFKGTERAGSYTPGTKWRVHVESCFAIVDRGPNIRGYHKYWINV